MGPGSTRACQEGAHRAPAGELSHPGADPFCVNRRPTWTPVDIVASHDKKMLAWSLMFQAGLMMKYRHDMPSATKLLQEQEDPCCEVADEDGLASGLMMQSNLFTLKGNTSGSLALLERAKEL